jgi:hypothetical protein
MSTQSWQVRVSRAMVLVLFDFVIKSKIDRIDNCHQINILCFDNEMLLNMKKKYHRQKYFFLLSKLPGEF